MYVSVDNPYRGKSYPEQYLAELLSHNYKKVESNKKMTNKMEADIVIWDINTIIEYNGIFWHSDSDRDKRKKEFIESKGVRLITIVEDTVKSKSQAYAKIVDRDTIEFHRYEREMMILVIKLGELLNKELYIPDDMEHRVTKRVYDAYGNQNLAYQLPDLAAEYSSNNKRKASDMFISDSETVEWICKKCSNTFYTSIGHRVYDKTGCPYCAGNKAIPEQTDIITVLPEFAKEIASLTEDELYHTLPYASKTVTWRCTRCKHEWSSTIRNRTSYNGSCPVCGYTPMDRSSKMYNIHEMCKIGKSILKVIAFGNVYTKINWNDLLRITFNYVIKNNIIKVTDIVDNLNYSSNKTCIPKLSYDSGYYNMPKLLAIYNNKNIYFEGKYGSNQFALTICQLLDIAGLEYSNIMIEPNYDKIVNEKVTNVNLNRSGNRYNVYYRVCGVPTFVGSRENFVDAVLLKLSSEIFFFGNIRNKNDINHCNNRSIPEFKDMPEFNKFIGMEGIGRNLPGKGDNKQTKA